MIESLGYSLHEIDKILRQIQLDCMSQENVHNQDLYQHCMLNNLVINPDNRHYLLQLIYHLYHWLIMYVLKHYIYNRQLEQTWNKMTFCLAALSSSSITLLL